jgi:hypothetical protein
VVQLSKEGVALTLRGFFSAESEQELFPKMDMGYSSPKETLNNFPLSFPLATPELPSVPSEVSKRGKIPSSLVLSESSKKLSMVCKTRT